jgi:AcrR family transcriptional regulator
MVQQMARVGRDITVDERKTEVLRAALICIAESGHESVRLRDVAKVAGVSIGSLQHYFESRDALVAQAFRQASDDLLTRWDDVLAKGLAPWERIISMIEGLTNRDALRTRCLVWVDFASAAARHSEVALEFAAVYRRWVEIFEEAVEEGVAEGVFTPLLSPETVVQILLEQIDGSMFKLASGIETTDGPQMRENSTATARALLGYRA